MTTYDLERDPTQCLREKESYKKVQKSYKIIHNFSNTPGNNIFCWRSVYVHSVGEKLTMA